MSKLKMIADSADMIINGYAFIKDGDNVRVVNLNSPDKALLMDYTGDVLETSMNDIEIDIVLDYYHRNKKYMEVQYALVL